MTLQEQLVELHELDARVRGMSRRLKAATARQKTTETRLDLYHRQHQELHDQLRACQVKASTLEKRVAEMDSRIDTLRQRMNSVTSNKEYSALLLEVNTLKVDKGKIEDEALEQMAQVEQVKQKLADAQQRIEDQQKLVAGAQREVTEARAEVGEKLDEATEQRDAAAAKVPAEVMSIFNRMAELFDGEAVCGIEEQDRRRMEYTCGGCYMTVPVERVNALITRPDELILCPNCSRILTISADLKQAIGAAK